MKADLQLKADVSAELVWDPAVKATGIGVAVQDGVVTLSGTVDTYAEKLAVERAVRRVGGVRGIALDLQVKLAPQHQRSDTQLAHAALQALAWQSQLPPERIKVEVEDGWVTLSGDLEWAYQVAIAEQCVRPLIGVVGVSNRITLRPQANAQDIAGDIAKALARHAEREAQRIQVQVEGSLVTLRGKVGSMAERKAVVGTAQAAKGVARVVDQLDIAL
jgi:osmotically-inducible protein OsmY